MQKISAGYLLIILSALFSSCGAPNGPETRPKKIAATERNSTASAGVSTARGKELFEQRCINCHGLSGNKRNNNAADLQLTRLDSIGIINTIINGRGAMPMFAHVMPDSDMAQLELYVKSLRKYQ